METTIPTVFFTIQAVTEVSEAFFIKKTEVSEAQAENLRFSSLILVGFYSTKQLTPKSPTFSIKVCPSCLSKLNVPMLNSQYALFHLS